MTKSHKMTFAALAAIAVALSLAVVPALTNQVFAAFPNSGQGHDTDATNRGGQEKDPDSPAAKCEEIKAGKSDVVKVEETDERCKDR
jgi:hypothetical protein